MAALAALTARAEMAALAAAATKCQSRVVLENSLQIIAQKILQ